MARPDSSYLLELLNRSSDEILRDWTANQFRNPRLRPELLRESELRDQSSTFLESLRTAISNIEQRQGDLTNILLQEWNETKQLLETISRSRSQKGFTPSETAGFIFSLKQHLFSRIRAELRESPDQLYQEISQANAILDMLALFTTEVFQRSREQIIARQQEEMLELSTPVVKLWDRILALPMIGTLDSARTQVVMESLLQKIVETGSEVAIIDITGVPTVDTLVAQHLLKTVAAARLMGADCIISGIRPQIAQTMVHLAVDLSNVTTKATLADAFLVALERLGHVPEVGRREEPTPGKKLETASLFGTPAARKIA